MEFANQFSTLRWPLLLGTLWVCCAADAQVLFQTGFEPPTYLPGPLSGRDGWSSPANGTVQAQTVSTGSQAVQFDPAGLTGQSGFNHGISYSSTNNLSTLVKIQVDFQVSVAGNQSDWEGISVDGGSGFLGQLTTASGNFGLGLANTRVGAVPVVRGVWHHLELDLDYHAQVLTAYVDSVMIGTGPFANPATTLTQIGMGVNSAPGTDLGYFDNVSVTAVNPAPPSINSGGVVPIYSSQNTIQPGEWVSIYGANLASGTAAWNGDFPTSIGGTSVTVNGKAAYLWFISPTQINMQAPNDTSTGSVPVVVTTLAGTSTSTVTLAQFAPSFSLLDSKHVTGIIFRPGGGGAYGGGAYDIIGPTGGSLGYPTVAAKAGDTVELFAVGLGPTNPMVQAGQAFSGDAPTTNSVNLLINNVNVAPTFAGLSSAGLYQINLTVPAGLGTGDVSLVATVGGAKTPSNVVISLQ
jgi:uncharacterized protein (TIGR03437 family)